MKIDGDLLYILTEGEPHSPEVSFFNRVISKLISQRELPYIEYEIIEVGGSTSFNNIAKMIYHKSQVHSKIPVIAIVDKDFRTQNQVNAEYTKSSAQLIQDKNAKKNYWTRHEWENFLLEETEVIADILNLIPLTPIHPKKPFKVNSIDTLTKQKLDKCLLDYFKSNIVNELIEYLRFTFMQKTNKQLRLDKYSSPLLQDIDPWFKSQLMEQAEKSKNHILALNSMLNDVLQEDIWKLSTGLLNNELNYVDPKQEEIFFQQAKIFFRGKEALRHLFKWAYTHLSICNLSYDEFINNLILPELEKNINSVIIQELKSMLHPLFLNL